MSLFKSGISFWLALWCCAVWIVYSIRLWPDLMGYACSAVKTFLESTMFLAFCLKFLGRKCQNLLFMLLPGTVAQNVWFNLSSPSVLAERKSVSLKPKSSVFLPDSESRHIVLTDIQRLFKETCFLGQSAIFKKSCLLSCPLCSWEHMITTDAFTAKGYQNDIV